MRFLKQSTSVDVVIGPVWATADGAFKSDLAYNASGINCDVYKVGTKADITLANSAGDGYFRAGSGEAQYILTLSTGHTDTLGMARITLSATGYAMKPEDFMVVPANVWDSLFGADKLYVDVAEISSDSTAADNLEDVFDDSTSVTNLKAMFDGTGYAGGTARLKVDIDTIKTQAVTCGAGVTVLASVGTAATATAQTGDAYAVVNNGTYGNPALKTIMDAFATDQDVADTTKTTMEAAGSHLALILADTGTDGVVLAADAITEIQSGLATSAEITALVESGYKKNTEVAAFGFAMFDSTDHISLKSGLTVTATRSLDGAAFGACANAVAEIGTTGVYKITLAAADMNADIVVLKFTATGGDTVVYTIKTSS